MGYLSSYARGMCLRMPPKGVIEAVCVSSVREAAPLPPALEECAYGRISVQPFSGKCCVSYPKGGLLLDGSPAPSIYPLPALPGGASITDTSWSPTQTGVLAISAGPSVHVIEPMAGTGWRTGGIGDESTVLSSVAFHPSIPGCLFACTYQGDLYCMDTARSERKPVHLHQADHTGITSRRAIYLYLVALRHIGHWKALGRRPPVFWMGVLLFFAVFIGLFVVSYVFGFLVRVMSAFIDDDYLWIPGCILVIAFFVLVGVAVEKRLVPWLASLKNNRAATEAAPTPTEGVNPVPTDYTGVAIIVLIMGIILFGPFLYRIWENICWFYDDAGLEWMWPIFNVLLIVGTVFLGRYLYHAAQREKERYRAMGRRRPVNWLGVVLFMGGLVVDIAVPYGMDYVVWGFENLIEVASLWVLSVLVVLPIVGIVLLSRAVNKQKRRREVTLVDNGDGPLPTVADNTLPIVAVKEVPGNGPQEDVEPFGTYQGGAPPPLDPAQEETQGLLQGFFDSQGNSSYASV
ncbi:hypothetical protein KIPB_002981 [Kipferlia bialata]|uniref:Uncharacterized protein n=1 Tax=Kipferlia bialata TaxID=797122 RepID=A0A9K3CSP9_9EUKA|nr:hypothetical protein KIPB_002981 [Kipferlia bialata]|eukprot:g2981.t1